MKNNGVKNEHKINTCRRTDQLWLFPSLHFMIFVMPAMFGSNISHVWIHRCHVS